MLAAIGVLIGTASAAPERRAGQRGLDRETVELVDPPVTDGGPVPLATPYGMIWPPLTSMTCPMT